MCLCSYRKVDVVSGQIHHCYLMRPRLPARLLNSVLLQVKTSIRNIILEKLVDVCRRSHYRKLTRVVLNLISNTPLRISSKKCV